MEVPALKILFVVLCAVLKLIGELWWHNAQRFILPVVLGMGESMGLWVSCWWIGFTALPAIGPITLGYKDFKLGDAGDRGMWLFLIALTIGAGPFFIHHLPWYFYVPYCIIAGIWGATTRNLKNVIIAPLSGALLGAIVFLIR